MLGTGLPVAAEAFDLEVYQLTCVFAARSDVLNEPAHHPGLRRLFSTFQQSEAARGLISIAAMVRSAMDTWSPDGARAASTPVGELQPDRESPNTDPLTFREACNKILHADAIDLIDAAEDNGLRRLRTHLDLYGSYRRKAWRATLDVAAFLEAASHVA